MALLDVVTLTEAKRALDIDESVTTHDVELAAYVTAVSQRLDSVVGPIVRRTVTDEAHDGTGTPMLTLWERPVASVTAVKERQGTTERTIVAENWSATTAYDYLLDPEAGIIYRRSGGAYHGWWVGGRNILVTYVAGRFADTASVDARFKQAAAITLSNLWRKEQGIAAEGGSRTPAFAVPHAARELLGDQLLAPRTA